MTKSLKRCSISRETNMMKRLKPCTTISSSSSSLFDNEDILTEILVRVPARYLIRCKCVSKHWLSLISDPEFCHHHTLRNPKPCVSALLHGKSRQIGFIPLETSLGSGSPGCNPLNFIPNLCLEKFDIIQSCNGLFLCSPEIQIEYPEVISAVYQRFPLCTLPSYDFVLNPTTKQFTKLIPPVAAAATITRARNFGYALAFDPSKSPHYKVVFLWSLDESYGLSAYHYIEIYSSETRSWKLLNLSFKDDPPIFKSGVYWNGAVHWVGVYTDVAYYHMEEERVGFVDAFPYYSREGYGAYRKYLKESSDGRLHLIAIDYPLSKFQVFEMGRDYCGWFVRYNVDLGPLYAAYPSVGEFFIIFLGKGENEEESSSLWLHAPGKVFSYNLKSNTIKSIDLIPQAGVNDSQYRLLWDVHQYMETMACV